MVVSRLGAFILPNHGPGRDRLSTPDEAARADASRSSSIADRPVKVNPRNSILDIHDVLVSEEGNIVAHV